MNLNRLLAIFDKNGCKKVYVKSLSPNDNSKNQVYLAGSFDLLNIFPIQEVVEDSSGDWKRDRFKASVKFSWITEDGNLSLAPNSQFILYPKYPEIRFSGFLSKSENPPSNLMTQRLNNRLLFLGVTSHREIIGFVTHPESELANEFNSMQGLNSLGVFMIIEIQSEKDAKEELLNELERIHRIGWIDSKRLDSSGGILPCLSPNCGGYTLEAELGITPNGFSEPDFLGWELKQYGVKSFDRTQSAIITLMTPEPTGGFYKEKGVIDFLLKYGYPDKNGKEDRINFGGVHRIGQFHSSTRLTLNLLGFDPSSGKITSSDGRIALIDENGTEAATWSFSSLIKHWNRKHNQACYVPSISEKKPIQKYKYGNKVTLGSNTDFTLLLKEMSLGNIYYDPGIKLENATKGKPKTKRRSQFRIKSANIVGLYHLNEIVDLSNR
ncbi:MAG: MvaI/BcnI restriction endonuclease family protein [Cyclobacteriaceae bacterium]|nr:MvaI/BcnI restriction endonuclease family protein [Cyclobacteriaceae bacterium]